MRKQLPKEKRDEIRAKQLRYLDRKDEYKRKYGQLTGPTRRLASRAAFGVEPIRASMKPHTPAKPQCQICKHQHPIGSDSCAQKNCGCIARS